MKHIFNSRSVILILIFSFFFLIFPSAASAAKKPASPKKAAITKPLKIPNAPVEKVNDYTTKKGTVVKPYYRTVPDKTKSNNFSTKGNNNPFTGKKGTK